MNGVTGQTAMGSTTPIHVVLPFYIYAAWAFLVSALLLLFSHQAFTGHYFHPHILAITHIMALGWGTMMIMGAAHQLLPVLSGAPLYSARLGVATFVLMAIGIPLLACGFYTFDLGAPSKWGGRFVLLGILTFLINAGDTVFSARKTNVHLVFVYTAMVWLFLTAFFGLALVYNFTYDLMPHDAVHYLPLHAHAGILGWFVLLVMGVASRLLPMFLMSMYTNTRLLWLIYGLVNASLVLYIILFYTAEQTLLNLLPWIMFFMAVVLFIWYCVSVYRKRLRKHPDIQLKYAFVSVGMMLLPTVLLLVIIAVYGISGGGDVRFATAYGFAIFFGWITAVILAMTFKTLPFIVWHKAYHQKAGTKNVPDPRSLFSQGVFRIMYIAYLFGFVTFASGILAAQALLLQSGAILLLVSALSFCFNVVRTAVHKPTVV